MIRYGLYAEVNLSWLAHRVGLYAKKEDLAVVSPWHCDCRVGLIERGFSCDRCDNYGLD